MNSQNDKLRIALISNNYTPYSGGVVSSIDAQTAALQEDGHLVRIITLNFLGGRHADPEHVLRIRTPIKFTCRNNHYAIPWYMVTQLRTLIRGMHADIVHIHHPFLLGAKGLEVARMLGIPSIFTYHTLYEEYAHYVPLPAAAAKPLIRRLVHRFCCGVDAIIAPSPAVAAKLRDQHITTRLRCIPSPLQSCFHRIPFAVRKRARQEPLKLLSVVRFTKEKNVTFLLDVCSLLDERFTMTLVGYGVEYQNLRSHAYEKLQLSPLQLQFVVKPDREQLLRHYRDADLFLFPSRTDTQGLVLAEAMACSTPVIAIPGPGQDGIVRHNQNGLLVATSREMAQAIEYLADSRETMAAMSEQAWRTAQNYLPEQFRTQLLSLYREAAEGRNTLQDEMIPLRKR